MGRKLHAGLMALCLGGASYSYACGDAEYESCWRVDLGPFGEARDCKCLPKVSGPIGQAGNEIRDAIDNVANELRATPDAVKDCIADISRCTINVLAAPLAIPVQAYITALYKQSDGKVKPFSPEFISMVQPYYGVDLNGLTYADDINTGHGMTVSYCDRIFFVGHGNVWQDKSELHHALHELEHSVQCKRRGSQAYLSEYVLKAGLDVVRSGRFNVHDVHDYEVAAENKANQLTDMLWAKIEAARAFAAGGNAGPLPVPPPFNPTAPPSSLVKHCDTPYGTCGIPPTMGFIGARCFCNSAYGQILGLAR
ncbi:hypothetical protein FHW68_000673 [Pseudomonas sp. Tn43]|uniref:hypothetical protein n=1 Tax=Pseudomonas sp. Tn43 TaxID=701213 RepID=UPI0016072A7A|nr:hypothetical protein [Pseudomonas sp. Tn43]MBB3239201.1 hypothetical protein [Pseudomonas sp. Tn43]